MKKLAFVTGICLMALGLYVIWHDLGPLAEGSYVAEATAVNEWGESGKSAPLNFTKAIPASPLNLRVSSE